MMAAFGSDMILITEAESQQKGKQSDSLSQYLKLNCDKR